MAQPPRMSTHLGHHQSLKQAHRLMMSPQMQQAIHMLQMPLPELALKVRAEIASNPIFDEEAEHINEENDIEMEAVELATHEAPTDSDTPTQEMQFDDSDFSIMTRLDEEFRDFWRESGNFSMIRTREEEKHKNYLESSILSTSTLFDSLMRQAHEIFEGEEELRAAEYIIGNLDDSGFLTTSLEEIANLNDLDLQLLERALASIQTFRPYGVGAGSLQESLLIQLRCRSLEESLAYRVIAFHFDELLHNRVPAICRELNITPEQLDGEIRKVMAHLDLHPGAWFARETPQHLTPDVTIKEETGELIAFVNRERLPSLRINHKYLQMLQNDDLPEGTREYLEGRLASGKWLMRNIVQRNDTLLRLAHYLIKQQAEYLSDPLGDLKPMTMRQVADALDIHESTVARAVSNKYLQCPRGLIPLRSLFTTSYATGYGSDVSAHTVKDRISEIIEREDKRKPLSDEAISKELQSQGIECARRTVSKHRKALGFGTTTQRRRYT